MGYFHQMHCLVTIRKLVQELGRYDEPSTASLGQTGVAFRGRAGIRGGSTPEHGHGGDLRLLEHAGHCFDYLRQVSLLGGGGQILASGD